MKEHLKRLRENAGIGNEPTGGLTTGRNQELITKALAHYAQVVLDGKILTASTGAKTQKKAEHREKLVNLQAEYEALLDHIKRGK